jgi:cytochrome P450
MKAPPGPRGGFLLGAFREVMSDGAQLRVLPRFAREYGDVVGFRMGPMRVALVSHPDLIEEVLVTRAKLTKKGFNEQLIRPVVGNGIFLSEGDFWKRQRRMMSPPLHKARIAGYGQIMVQAAEKVASRFVDGEVRDLYEDVTEVGMAVAAKALFGVDVKEAAGFATALTDLMSAVKARIESPLPLPDWLPTANTRRLKRSRGHLDTLIHQAIAERRASQTEREDLLSLLLAARDEEDGKGMTEQQLSDEAMTLLLAGFETTAINLAWTLHLLSLHPQIADELRAEISATLGDRPATAADVPNLKAVERVVQEAMRLYPPGWIVDRVTLEDMELGGFHISKGTDIWIAPWIVHRDPRFWSEPEKFLPERFKSPPTAKFVYFPFGGGPRVCIGNAFAMMEVVLVITTFIRRFQLEAVEAPPTPDPGFTLRPIPGVRLRVRSVN